jgi:predicted ester cyclase
VDDLIEQGNKVAVRWSVRATHTGRGLGLMPTNQPVAFRGMTWMEIRDGKFVRGWDSWNMGALMQTLASGTAAG